MELEVETHKSPWDSLYQPEKVKSFCKYVHKNFISLDFSNTLCIIESLCYYD